MNWIHQTITEFGASIGLPTLALGPENQVRLGLETGGEIRIDYLADFSAAEVLVSHSAPLEPEYSAQMRQALRLTDFRNGDNWAMLTAIRDDQIVLAMRVPEREFSLSALEGTLTQLMQMHRSIFLRR